MDGSPAEGARQGDEDYRDLFESIEQGFCIFEMLYDADGHPRDYRFLAVNPTFERHTGLKDAVGKTARELVPGLENHWVEIYGRVAETGEPYQFEQGSAAMGRAFAVEAVRVGGAGSRRVALLFTDVTTRRRAEEALRESARRDAFRAALTDALRPLTDPEAVQSEAARLLGDYLGVNRAFYAEADEDGEHVLIRRDYHEGVPSAAGRYRLDDFGPALADALRSGRTFTVGDTGAEGGLSGEERAAYDAIAVRAHATICLVKDGRLVALLGVHQAAPRAWTADEVALLEETAERTWAAVERARVEAALRESEVRFRTMADHAPVMIWMTAPDGACTYLSRSWYAFTGQTPATGLGFGWLDAVHPDDRDAAGRTFVAATREGAAFRLDYRLRRADGEYRWAIDSAQPRFGASGDFLGFIGSVIDITERVETEAALRASEERYRAFVASSAEGVYRLEFDPPIDTSLSPDEQIALIYRDGRFAECNDAFARMYGFARAEEIVGQGLDLMLPPGDADARAYLRFLIESGYRASDVESVEHGRDGQPLYFANAVTGVVEVGRLVRAWGTQRDITDRKLAEEGLRESEGRLRQLADAMPQLVWIADAGGTVRYYNRRATEYAGLVPTAEGDWAWQPMLHPDDLPATLDAWARAMRERAPYAHEHRIQMADGAYRWHLSRAAPSLDADGAVGRWYGTATDIHDLKGAEAERQALLDALAHDLKNPLAALKGQAQLLQRQLRRGIVPEPDALAERVAGFERLATRMTALLDELGEGAATPETRTPDRQPTDFAALVRSVADDARRAGVPHAIGLTIAQDPLVGVWNTDQLARVVGNLLDNAIKYSPSGGAVGLELVREDDAAVLRVRDAGIGIPATDLPHIFAPRRRGGNVGAITGSGIGLASARRIVEAHGGTIGAESAEGRGTTLTVRLPLRAEPAD